MNKGQLILIGIVVIVLTLICCGCGSNSEDSSTSDDSSPKVSSPEISGAEVVENAKKNLLRVAKVMGSIDLILAERVIHFVEGGEMASGVPWSMFDDSMKPTTKETQAAYHKYRSAVIKRALESQE